MLARLKFLTARPARLECFAEAPRNFAGRPEDNGRVFRGAEQCPIEGRDVLSVDYECQSSCGMSSGGC